MPCVAGAAISRVREGGDLKGQYQLYSHHMLTKASQLDVMNRLGRAMADPTRSRILLSLLDHPGYPSSPRSCR
jgi:hypothetical protein